MNAPVYLRADRVAWALCAAVGVSFVLGWLVSLTIRAEVLETLAVGGLQRDRELREDHEELRAFVALHPPARAPVGGAMLRNVPIDVESAR